MAIVSHRTCSVENCERPMHGRDWCRGHYSRWHRHGDVQASKPLRAYYMTPEEALAARTEWQGDCLIWTGHLGVLRYGQISVDGQTQYAHRYVWELEHGPITDGSHVDHRCRNTQCVNVDHLRLATRAENLQNRSGPAGNNTASGVRNVSRNKKRWMVTVTKEGIAHHYGTYDTVDEAAVVAKRARLELFGEWAGGG